MVEEGGRVRKTWNGVGRRQEGREDRWRGKEGRGRVSEKKTESGREEQRAKEEWKKEWGGGREVYRVVYTGLCIHG